MMRPQDLLAYVHAQPFRPFRIRMNSGRTFDIRRPVMVRVARDCLILCTFVSDNPNVVDHWETISLLLIESISHLDAPVS